MKALVLKQYNQLVYTDVPTPAIAPNEVLVQVKACGICGSDVHGATGSTGRRIPPIIMGHEASGVIAAVGAEVPDWQSGDRVAFDIVIHCGHCYYCQRGLVNLCDQRRALGVSTPEFRLDGAFAEYVAVPHNILHRLPDAVSFIHAAVMEPLAVVAYAVNRLPITLQDSAVVMGTGMIGLLAVQLLKRAGCGQVIVVGRNQKKLDLALQLGADTGLNLESDNIKAQVHRRTGGRGADVAVEAIGLTHTLNLAIGTVRKGGALALLGNFVPTVDLPLQEVVTRHLTLLGTIYSTGQSQACLEMIASGAVDVAPLISAVAPLSEGAIWFERLQKREPGLVKVILSPDKKLVKNQTNKKGGRDDI